jgi:hypothetical protein
MYLSHQDEVTYLLPPFGNNFRFPNAGCNHHKFPGINWNQSWRRGEFRDRSGREILSRQTLWTFLKAL